MGFSKSGLAIALSSLNQFENPKIMLEQYSTDSQIAADILWFAYMQGDIKDKVVADLGCGPGIFGLGAALLGAKEVFFIDKDDSAIKTCLKNISLLADKVTISSLKLVESDISNFSEKVDTVLENPPFGTRIKHHDRIFLERAFSISKVIYSLHKSTSRNFIEAFSKDMNFNISHVLPYKMWLKKTLDFHKKNKVEIDVACFRIVSKRFK